MGYPDVADRCTGPGDAEGRRHRLASTDAFQDVVDANPIGHVHDSLGRRVATLGNDVCRTERAGQRLEGWVPAEGDQAGGAHAVRAPRAKRTTLPRVRRKSRSRATTSNQTSPVNVSAAPLMVACLA